LTYTQQNVILPRVGTEGKLAKMNNKYTKEFDEWFETERKNGLLDLKFFTGKLEDSTPETFAEEAIKVLKAKKTPLTRIDF